MTIQCNDNNPIKADDYTNVSHYINGIFSLAKIFLYLIENNL